MSRSGYVDDIEDQWSHIRWRGAVKASFLGKRGQSFLKEALVAFDAMPVRELARGTLKSPEGSYCTLGVVCADRNLDITGLDPDDTKTVADTIGLSEAMVREIVYMNDEAAWYSETPSQRWSRMREWIVSWIRPDSNTKNGITR
jgi:hypothetical protein